MHTGGGESPYGGESIFCMSRGGGNLNFFSIIFFYQFITGIIYKIWCPDIYFLNSITNGTFW